MQNVAKKAVTGLLVATLMAGAIQVRPAQAKSNSGRNILIGVVVVGAIYYLATRNKNKKMMAAAPLGHSRYFASTNRTLVQAH